MFAPARKSLNGIEKLKATVSLVDTSLTLRDSPRPVIIFVVGHVTLLPCYPVTLLMGVSTKPNIHPLTRYCERYSWGRELGGGVT